jgi:agmatine/peptidylarginine deiminase
MRQMDRQNETSKAARAAAVDTPIGRMPAEWEPHAGCFMGWPGNPRAWGRDLDGIQRDYARVAQAIADFEPVTMVVDPVSKGRG